MVCSERRVFLVVLTISLLMPACISAASEDGAALFEKNCAICHKAEQAQNRTPTPQALMRLSKTAILGALEGGVMKVQGAALSPAQRQSLAFANLVSSARQRTGGALTIVVAPGGQRLAAPYPRTVENVTAGQWNEVAARNNRVEFSVIAD